MPKPPTKPPPLPSSAQKGPGSAHREGPSAPEIVVTGTGSIGRETLVEIAEHEANEARAALTRKRHRPAPSSSASPSSHASSAGSSAAAQAPPSSHAAQSTSRSPLTTLSFEEKPPSAPMVSRPGSAPEIEIGYVPAVRPGEETIATELAGEVLRTLSRSEQQTFWAQVRGAQVHESFSFVVRGAPVLASATLEMRLQFIKARLLHRLPVRTVNEIASVDVRRHASDDALVIEIWVPVKTAP